MDGATTLFAENGYHGTGIAEIAQEVGLRGGALYYHIGSKEELLWEILSTYTVAVLDEAEIVAASDQSPTERLHDLIVRQIRLIVRSTRQMTIEIRDRSALNEIRLNELQEIRERIQAIWQQVLDDGFAQGDFDSADHVLTNTILTTVNGVAHWYRPEGRYSADEVGERIAQLILRGVVGGAGKVG